MFINVPIENEKERCHATSEKPQLMNILKKENLVMVTPLRWSKFVSNS